MSILFYIFALYGITLIISEGKIFLNFRIWLSSFKTKFFYNLVTCMMCLGFWLGLITGLILNDNIFGDTINASWLDAVKMALNSFLFGGLISGTNWLLHLMQLNLEKKLGDEL